MKLLIPRRKLLLGAVSLLAAPAIIGKAEAQLMLTGAGGVGCKPLGNNNQDAFIGCIVNLLVDDISRNWNGTLSPSWLGETVDTDGFHSVVSNQSLITIPSSVNGRYGIFSTTCVLINGTGNMWMIVQIQQNSANAIAINGWTQISTTGLLTCTSYPILLTTGDTYRVLPQVSDTTTVLQASNSNFSCIVVG